MAAAVKFFTATFFSFRPLMLPRKKKKKQQQRTRCEHEEKWKLSDEISGRIKHKPNPTLPKNSKTAAVRKRMPSKMADFLQRNRRWQMRKQKEKKVVMEAVRMVRQLASRRAGSYNIRHVLSPFIGRLSFRDMCVVLKDLQGWRQAGEFFDWMKLQVVFKKLLSCLERCNKRVKPEKVTDNAIIIYQCIC